MTYDEFQKNKFNLFNWMQILMDMEAKVTLSKYELKQIEHLELPLQCIQALIDSAAKNRYHQVYLIALKRKEQLNGFSQTNNFKL